MSKPRLVQWVGPRGDLMFQKGRAMRGPNVSNSWLASYPILEWTMPSGLKQRDMLGFGPLGLGLITSAHESQAKW